MFEECFKDETKKRIAFIQPESNEEVLISSCLLPSIKKQYPEYDIYFFTKSDYFDLINSNPYVHKVLPYTSKMDDPLYFEGKGDFPKYFDIVYAPYLSIRNNNFTRNNKDIIQYNIYESN